MRRLGILCALGLLAAGCSAPHAARVRCDAHLTPINSAGAHAAGPLASILEPRGENAANTSTENAPRGGAAFAASGDSAGVSRP